MTVNIIIPTHDRPISLKRTVDSILKGDYKDVRIYIVIDGNAHLSFDFPYFSVVILRNEQRMDWIYSVNRALKEMVPADAVLAASDDLIFPGNALTKATEVLKEWFPDGDGVISLKQSCPGVDSAFGFMGKKFIERFPDNQVYCPDYIHYVSDVELGNFAKSINKFYYCNDVVLQHARPTDKTRELGLTVLTEDRLMATERKKQGLLWGRNFNKLKSKEV